MIRNVQTPIAFEQRLARDPRWALSEASEFLAGKGEVWDAFRKITSLLKELGIPYTVVGGMALVRHGYNRVTTDVDLLVTRDGLRQIHEKLDGLGYLPPFEGSKNLRDTEYGVKIEFLVSGGYPGDGKPKPVSFPDPLACSSEIDGIRFLNLESLIELKLASGISSPGRLRDLADVMELVKALNLPQDFSQRLNPYVREKYQELWLNSRVQDPTELWGEAPDGPAQNENPPTDASNP
jgi:hypothetical protein